MEKPIRRLLPMLPLLIAFGCAHKPEAKKESPATANTSSAASNPRAASTPQPSSCTRDLDCGEKQLCIRNQCVDISAGLAECLAVRVHFQFNSAELDSESRLSLERSARCLKADHAIHITVEGNADERGTEEYNLALGDRRATAIAKCLEMFGASEAQLKTVSYGKENPLCTEHDEACWAKNRRGELKLVETGGKRKRR